MEIVEAGVVSDQHLQGGPVSAVLRARRRTPVAVPCDQPILLVTDEVRLLGPRVGVALRDDGPQGLHHGTATEDSYAPSR